MFRTLLGLIIIALTLSACSETPTKKSGPSQSSCGNGVLDQGEACDPNIDDGNEGACPKDCGGDACSAGTLVGSASACTATCEAQAVACTNGDGCCGLGCDSETDDDCSNTCGNGVVEEPETCDGDCGECDDGNSCTSDISSGDADNCSQTCTFEPITACASDDGCCPAGCDSDTDSDCSDSCGDGVIDPNETCDGNCPTDCNDNNDCTDDVLLGSANTCSSSCTNEAKTACVNDDGCCPTGCEFSNDNDCTCVPTTTCTSMGWVCGTIADDGCGKTEVCGTCNTAGGEVCTANNRCEQGYKVGERCTNDAACSSTEGVCFDATTSGFPGGYCSKGCRSDADCGANHCDNIGDDGNGACFQSCQANADCRAGYECFDWTGNGVSECMAVGSGNRAIGDACNTTADCGGGQGASCATESNSGTKDGYCLDTCSTNADCGAGAHCIGNTCLKNCTSNNQCRNSGYACYDVEGDGQNECWLSGTGNSPVGGPCQGVWDCGGDQWATCGQDDAGFPGGFCTLGCDLDQGVCPTGSACSADVGEFCLPLCPNGNECRTGYSCNAMDVGDACFL